ncbi:MAG: M15 family metallopeptidase [Blastocatellia bacterium]|nr:M15 family metallopeptidase [Blastocatellia bacterium]
MKPRRWCSISHILLLGVFAGFFVFAQLQSSCKAKSPQPSAVSTPIPPIATSSPSVSPLPTTIDSPPVEEGKFRQPDLIELVKLEPTIKLDVRYATSNNFVGRPLYTEARAFLQRPAAEALRRAHQKLRQQGYGLLIFDGYRPWAITKLFWEVTPPNLHNFVADPRKGSKHNRGCAIDLSLFDLKTGQEVPMPGAYDEMTERSYPTYKGGTAEQRRTRDVLRAAMEGEGFTVNEYEWWHFDYKDWRQYPILNVSFAELSQSPEKSNRPQPIASQAGRS